MTRAPGRKIGHQGPKSGGRRDQILVVLEGGSHTTAQIAQALGVKPAAIVIPLDWLACEGSITKAGPGAPWRLAAAGEAA